MQVGTEMTNTTEMTERDVERAILHAEQLLPGQGPIDCERDARWQALLGIRRFVADEPSAVWEFASRWGAHSDRTLRHAVAVCVVQELIACHFEALFGDVTRLVRASTTFAETFRLCAKYGRSAEPGNARTFDRLMLEARRV